MEKRINAKNLIMFAAHLRETRGGKATRSDKKHFMKVKCHLCDSEGCKSCDYTGLITIK